MQLGVFPLGRALLPGAELSLQIFEQRYVRLIRDVLESDSSFAIAGLLSGGEVGKEAEFSRFAVLAKIHDWDLLPSGLLGIRVRGEERLKLESIEQQEDDLWVAEATLLTDSRKLALPADYAGLQDLLCSIDQALNIAQKSRSLHDSPPDCAALGWELAARLPLSSDDYTQLLAENDPIERLESLALAVDRFASQ